MTNTIVTIEKPKPLVSRALRLTVPERVDVSGGVRLPLDEDAVQALVPILEREQIESVAVVFLHAYVNPAHEQRTAAILHEKMPGLSITLSSRSARRCASTSAPRRQSRTPMCSL